MLEIVDDKLVRKVIDEQLHFCPVCDEVVQRSFVRPLPAGGGWVWLNCACGALFSVRGQDEVKAREKNAKPEMDIEAEKLAPKLLHPYQTYLPVIEEIVIGRKLLGIGQKWPHGLQLAKERGWIVFGLGMRRESLPPYDLIWAEHAFQARIDWKAQFYEWWKMLEHGGLIYLDMPDTQFLSIKGPNHFIHLVPWENRLMWRMETFCEHARGYGFNVVLSRRNADFRCLQSANMQVILQKRG